MRASKPKALALRALLRSLRNARGATLLASLESELSDSASLRYLRRRSSSCGTEVKNPFFYAIKQKDSRSFEQLSFWRRRKDLNLRAGYPTYTLSRGASSPLEYFSILQAWFSGLPNYYIKFFSLCQVILYKKTSFVCFIINRREKNSAVFLFK